jgi:hypothetical protein
MFQPFQKYIKMSGHSIFHISLIVIPYIQYSPNYVKKRVATYS